MPDIEEKLDILAEIIKEDCVLVIGPHAYLAETAQGKTSLFELLSQKLVTEVPDLQELAKSKDFHLLASEFEKRKNKTALQLAVKQFYENNQTNVPILETLVQLPFSLIINTTPDDLLLRCMEKNNKLNFHADFYNYTKQGKNDLFTDVSADKPLIYNLLGSTKERTSMVLTQSQQLAFIKNIISEDAGLPKSLLSLLQEKTHYLFIGFDFEYWYLRLVFQTLGLDKRPETAFGFHQKDIGVMKLPTKIFFSNEYNIEFLEDEPEEFLRQLKERLDGKRPLPPIPVVAKKVCILCHPDDEAMYDKLALQLKPLFKQYHVEVADYQSIAAGDVTEIAMENAVKNADLLLPLLSADFLADDYWVNLVALQEAKKTVPILLRHCDIHNVPSICNLPTILPLNRQPINKWQDRNEALQSVKNAIEIILKNLAA